MLTDFLETLINKLKQKGTTQVNANNSELEMQKRAMDHAKYLAEYNADREARRHHFNATIILAGHALKSAILINGGAAVGMLTFIGNHLSGQSRITFAYSLLWYVAGVFFAAFATGLSYVAQDLFMKHDEQEFNTKYLHHAASNRKSDPKSFTFCLSLAVGAMILSYLCFVIGSGTACSGFINY